MVTIQRDRIASTGLGGLFLGRPVEIDLSNAPAERPSYQARARAIGTLTAEAMTTELGLPLDGIVAGETPIALDILFPRAGGDDPVPVTFEITSMLRGLSVGMPAPLGKTANESRPVAAAISIVPDATGIFASGEFGDDGRFDLDFLREAGEFDFDRGIVHFGSGEMTDAETRGLHLRGRLASVSFDEWLELARRDSTGSGAADRIRSIDVDIGELRVLGQLVVEHRVRVDRSARDWLVQFNGDALLGSIFVPYDFGGTGELVLDMERLFLPGPGADAANEQTVEPASPDPRRLPAMSIRAGEFALGERHFGSLEARLTKSTVGLEIESLVTEDESFEVTATGRWVAAAGIPAGARTELAASLTSRNVQETMERLAYAPGIDSDEMSLDFDIEFSGAPRHDFLDALNGRATVRFGPGQLQEVEPGAGRMFGLMSVVALPRRLALDFSDVFGRGFAFDAIDGEFRIVDGEAYTCDLSLQGPAADIAIIGRTGLGQRDYNQAAVVTAEVGNSLPVVVGVMAGPQAAAATLIFSQIFKKPLADLGQAYYVIGGPWDEPVIESSDAAGFAGRAELAGCLAESQGDPN